MISNFQLDESGKLYYHLFLYQIFIFHNIKKTAAYIIFILYLTAMCFLVGFPSVTGIKIGWSYNFIPFYGMLNDITNSYLNVLLFIPLGIFVPCLWPEYRSMMKTVGLGLMTSLGIEILQIFTFRATDINDVITNVAGTILVSEILLYVKIENVIVRLNAEDCIIKSYLAAGLLTFDI